MKATKPQDITIGGPALAAQAFRAGLVDECQLFIVPVIVGEGKFAFPTSVRLHFQLEDERRFGNGMAYLQYRSANTQAA